jgi:hypothetical protein
VPGKENVIPEKLPPRGGGASSLLRMPEAARARQFDQTVRTMQKREQEKAQSQNKDKFPSPDGDRTGGNSTMNTAAQESNTFHPFVRVLGDPPRSGAVRMMTVESFDLFTETFGPPERRSHKRAMLLVWNFVRLDRNDLGVFSLSSQIPNSTKITGNLEIEVRLTAERGVKSFIGWTIDRLAGVESGEELPSYVGNGKHTITRL